MPLLNLNYYADITSLALIIHTHTLSINEMLLSYQDRPQQVLAGLWKTQPSSQEIGGLRVKHR